MCDDRERAPTATRQIKMQGTWLHKDRLSNWETNMTITWTLVVFTFLTSAGSAGGASTSVASFRFAGEESCEAAAKAISDSRTDSDGYSRWQIIGKCIRAGN
jgi:hypothetical protein